MGFSVAIVGATGAVGECMRELLEERKFPVDRLHLLASGRSAGSRLSFRGSNLRVEDLADFDFRQAQICFFSAGGAISADFAPRAVEAGCIVIDNTSHFRQDPKVPLIVPEVNPHRLEAVEGGQIIANPNCSTIQMLVALKPLHDAVGIRRIDVATYQSVSGAGRSAIQGLAGQTERLLNGRPLEAGVFPRQMAFNVLPQIGDFDANGYTSDEMKMVHETQKILEDQDIEVNATCVRVPVFFGHSEAVHLRMRKPLGSERARELLREASGVQVLDEQSDYPTPVEHAAGQDPVYVGRIRNDLCDPCRLNLWIVADNIRKGAALNSIQIAEVFAKQTGMTDTLKLT